MNRVFIGYDSRQDMAYRVLKYSIEKHSSRSVDIRPLVLKDLEKKMGFRRAVDPLASTEFTYTRFLVPDLCEFKGTAVFMDCDMLCLADIHELFELDLSDCWLRVVKHNYQPAAMVKMDGRIQTQYPRKNWSSLMLLNCEKLTMRSKENVETKSGAWLHRFEAIPDERLGEIPKVWNVLERYDKDTKLIHYTEGGPWYEHLKDHPYGDIWFRYRDECLESQKSKQLLGAR